jgi:hypothetical protein
MEKRFAPSVAIPFLGCICAIASLILFPGALEAQIKNSPSDKIPALNQDVLVALKTMPREKGYDASQAAVDRLAASVSIKDGVIQEDLNAARASFCSGATYIVFLRTIQTLRNNGRLNLSAKTIHRLAQMNVKDGEVVFGRWNANGPGCAKLFAELKCGTNFTSFADARPGDFMKIWWTPEIGGNERGHHVIYLDSDQTTVRFWSANQPDGYGIQTVEKSTIKHVIFSRLERIERLENVAQLSDKNEFLADMLIKRFTWKRVVKECNVTEHLNH